MEMKNMGLRKGNFPGATATCQLQGIMASEYFLLRLHWKDWGIRRART
jgi:hypothetical protein